MALFIPWTIVTLYQFYSITSPVLFTKNYKLYDIERKEDFFCVWLVQRVSRYIKGDRKSHF